MKKGSDSGTSLREVLAQFEHGFTGDGDDLKTAFENAWEKGKSSGHRVFRVQEIFIQGDNPISGYGVVITPSG